ncbi:MAG: PEP-CTERM sorting domain-containing protein, partial [Spirulina sp.]
VVSFLDLSLNLPGTPGNTADGLLTFDVTSNDGLDITQQVQNLIAIDISLGGIFNTNAGSPNNETSYGQAIFTLQYAEDGITVDSFQTRLAAGEIFEGITFSGAAFTATGIPEPATVLGLLAVTGLAGTAIRKRKADV